MINQFLVDLPFSLPEFCLGLHLKSHVWSVGFTRPLSWYLAIALPASIVGILYLINWFQRDQAIHPYSQKEDIWKI